MEIHFPLILCQDKIIPFLLSKKAVLKDNEKELFAHNPVVFFCHPADGVMP
jgi:hypothetical protein